MALMPAARAADVEDTAESSAAPHAAARRTIGAFRRSGGALATHPNTRVLGVTGILLLIAVATWSMPLTRQSQHTDAQTHLAWWAVAALVLACELVVLHIQVRREAHAISLSELAVVLGLFFATPVGFVVGRGVGSLIAFAGWRRQAIVKILFNLSLYVAESTLTLALFHLVRGGDPTVSPRAWTAACAATVCVGVVSSVAVTIVIALVGDGLRLRDLVTESIRGVMSSLAVTSVALVAVHALDADPRAVVPMAVALALQLFVYRAYSGLSERHLSLERLYRFSHAVSSTPEVDEILAGVLEHAREVLRAEYADVVFLASEPDEPPVRISEVAAALRRDRLSEDEAGDPLWVRVVHAGTPLLLQRGQRDAGVRAFLASRKVRDAVLVPLRGDAGIVGTIMVGDRMGEVRTFDEDDVQLLMTVANHASMALQNGQLVDRLRHDAMHDALTGLPNRTAFNRSLGQVIGEVRAGRLDGAAVMIADLVGFKQVNDTLGHHLGDLLLREIGVRMESVVRTDVTVARLGGDEFALVIPDVVSAEAALALGRELHAALEEPIGIEDVAVEVGASIGISLAPSHGMDGGTLLRRADAAMYEAKNSGSQLEVYDASLDAGESREQLALVAELRQGIQIGELEIHVQPQAIVATGRVAGVEALVRWRHPRHGLLFPDEFIPLAERSGLIRPMTLAVLAQAIAAVGRWRAEGHDLTVAVNLSARSTINDEVVDAAAQLLAEHGVPPEALTLEITESSVMRDPMRTREVLDRLHALGVRLSIDDFGTGYSSMSYLRQLPVQEVKVDKGFVGTMSTSPEDATIVRSIVDLAGNLGLVVVAEGVEDQETWDALGRMGCDLVQGYHLARPMPADAFSAWLARRQVGLLPAARVARDQVAPATRVTG